MSLKSIVSIPTINLEHRKAKRYFIPEVHLRPRCAGGCWQRVRWSSASSVCSQALHVCMMMLPCLCGRFWQTGKGLAWVMCEELIDWHCYSTECCLCPTLFVFCLFFRDLQFLLFLFHLIKIVGAYIPWGKENPNVNSFSWFPLLKSKVATNFNIEVRTDGLLALCVISC